MKRFCLAFIGLLVFFSVFAQKKKELVINIPYNSEVKLYQYSEVIFKEGETQDVLFEKSSNWIKSFFEKEAILLSDIEKGKLLERGEFTVRSSMDVGITNMLFEYNIKYKLEVFVKDNKYKYILSDFVMESFSSGAQTEMTIESYIEYQKNNKLTTKKSVAFVNDILNQINVGFQNVISSYTSAMDGVELEDKW